MWGESSKTCENNCQCSGLITDNFTINSGNSATKRRRDEALLSGYKYKMTPHSLDLSKSPSPPKRRVLGLLENQENCSPNLGLHETSYDTVDFARTPKHLTKTSPPQKRNLYENEIFSRDYLKPSPFKSPTPRKVLGELQNRSPAQQPTPKRKFNPSPLNDLNTLTRSPLFQLLDSPKIFSPVGGQSFKKISRIFEERSRFKMENNEKFEERSFFKMENVVKCEERSCFKMENVVKCEERSCFKMENVEKFEEETRDAQFKYQQENWTAAKLDFTDVLQTSFKDEFKTEDTFVPEKEELDPDFDTLHDLEEEFENDTFEQCNKYEIISTDSPDIISRGRSASNRKINGNFVFGAPLADTEQSTSFNRPARALNFEDSFEFTSPVIKKTMSSGSVKKSLKFNETPTKDSMKRIFTSESTTSMESGFVSEFDDQLLEIEESNSPKVANFDDLLSGPIKTNITTLKNPLCRSMSFDPRQSKAKVSLLSILESPQRRSQKRSEPGEGGESKRRRCEERRPVLQRCFSENNASIMSALDRSDVNPDLIGDFSQPFALPLTRGNHADLKSISCDTLAGLMRGEFSTVTDFQVIDCRYPYEFEGGHIAGAQNLYTPAQVLSLVQGPRPTSGKTVLVFHCEFSLERGPKLSRFLRSSDREKNKENYPSLHYPEVYLLHEGYRAFYQRHPDLCSPAGYTAMLDPKHRHLLRQHRSVQQPSSSAHRRNRLLF